MIVKQYLREQIAKSRIQTLVTLWSINPTNCDISYNPYTAHMYKYTIHDTNVSPNDSDEKNQINNNNSDRHHNNMDTQQDNVEINNMNIPQVEHNDGPKAIRTRSGKINDRPFRLGIMEK